MVPRMKPKRPLSAPSAFVSDVHGNLPALEAVLAELAQRAVGHLYVAGDLLLGGDQPLEVWRRLTHMGAVCVLGTSDLALCRVDERQLQPMDVEGQTRVAQFIATRRALGEPALLQLSRLPQELRMPLLDGTELLLVHGSPADPLTCLSHDMEDDEMEALLASDGANIVVCGGTHVPFRRRLDDIEVVNVGSVGEAPEGNCAHFTVITPKANGTQIEQAWVNY